ncbi:MAG: hypothetical protein NTX64_04000 [Elusimicrobia bacterium]|nr:hypothetical protein [Elusimicrobiota bacterium]
MRTLETERIRWIEHRPSPGARWAKALVLAALAGLTAFVVSRLARGSLLWTPPAVRAADFISGIPGAKERLRLVVAVLEINKSAVAESEKSLFGVDLGTTRVSMTVPARIHYALDLSGPRPVDFRLHAAGRELVALFPDPSVEAVELMVGGKRVTTEVGWARLKSRSGYALEDGIERGLYGSVWAEGSSPAVIEQIKERARPVLARLLNEYLRRANALGPNGIAVTRIQFKGDTENSTLALLDPRWQRY